MSYKCKYTLYLCNYKSYFISTGTTSKGYNLQAKYIMNIQIEYQLMFTI